MLIEISAKKELIDGIMEIPKKDYRINEIVRCFTERGNAYIVMEEADTDIVAYVAADALSLATEVNFMDIYGELIYGREYSDSNIHVKVLPSFRKTMHCRIRILIEYSQAPSVENIYKEGVSTVEVERRVNSLTATEHYSSTGEFDFHSIWAFLFNSGLHKKLHPEWEDEGQIALLNNLSKHIVDKAYSRMDPTSWSYTIPLSNEYANIQIIVSFA